MALFHAVGVAGDASKVRKTESWMVVVIAVLLCSNVAVTLTLQRQRRTYEALRRSLAPQPGSRTSTILGRTSPRGVSTGQEISFAFDPTQTTLIMLAQAECRPCREALPDWELAVRRVRAASKKVRVLVLDRNGPGQFDEIDDRIHPDVRMVPSAESIVGHGFLESPMFAVAKRGVFTAVFVGRLSGSQINSIVNLARPDTGE
jgi:hypothetical protein